jgi:membrane-bound ClpP family serine protease
MIIWIAIISLIIIGLALLVIELFFIPGTTIVGIIGLLCVIFSLVLIFNNFGDTAGWVATGGTAILSASVFLYAFKSGAWSKFALKGRIDSKVNQDKPIQLKVGDEGIARSTLRPIGKGEFENELLEVRSLGELVPTDSKIRVIKVNKREIFVEPINL